MNELGNDPAENDGIRRIREQYEEECRNLEQERGSVKIEAERLYQVFIECHSLLLGRDFRSLCTRLDAEGMQFTRSDLTQESIGDIFALKIITLLRRGERLDARFERVNAQTKTSQTCHRCGGMGTIEKESHYEHEGGRATPVRRVEDCALCGGQGRIWLGNCVSKKRR